MRLRTYSEPSGLEGMESMNTCDQQNGVVMKRLKNKAAAMLNLFPHSMFPMGTIHTLNRQRRNYWNNSTRIYPPGRTRAYQETVLFAKNCKDTGFFPPLERI
jgi:hypothetical protein